MVSLDWLTLTDPARMAGGSGPRGYRCLAMMTTAVGTKTWMCLICGWIYDEAAGVPESGIAPGTKWEEIPPNWTCPECGARKEDFEMVEI
jgi:rubredoxin